jgi:hypothetical protein
MRSRIDEFLEEIGEALRDSVEVQRAFSRLRDELELAFEAFASTDAGREANRARLQRLMVPLHFVRRLEEDTEVAAAFLQPFEGRVLSRREEAFDVLSGVLEALRASGGGYSRDGRTTGPRVLNGDRFSA